MEVDAAELHLYQAMLQLTSHERFKQEKGAPLRSHYKYSSAKFSLQRCHSQASTDRRQIYTPCMQPIPTSPRLAWGARTSSRPSWGCPMILHDSWSVFTPHDWRWRWNLRSGSGCAVTLGRSGDTRLEKCLRLLFGSRIEVSDGLQSDSNTAPCLWFASQDKKTVVKTFSWWTICFHFNPDCLRQAFSEMQWWIVASEAVYLLYFYLSVVFLIVLLLIQDKFVLRETIKRVL